MSIENCKRLYSNESSIILIPQDLRSIKYSGYIILQTASILHCILFFIRLSQKRTT